MTSNAKTHKITTLGLGLSDFIPISASQFEKIRAAKMHLMFGVGIEEKFDLVLENYAELERSLLEMALEHSIFHGKIETLLDGGTHLVNRRIANLLTTARLYLDQIPHELSNLYGKGSPPCDKFKKATKTEYDSILGYRVMEALRNHVQHRSLPTHGINFNITRDETHDPNRRRFSVVPLVSLSELEDDPKFKKTVLKDLQEFKVKDGYANLLPFIKEYVEALGRIHMVLREVTIADLAEAD